MQDSGTDYYEVLHLHPSAPAEVIEAAYRRLVRIYHPDVNQSPEAHDLMVQLNLAYGILSDPEKRADYDRSREAQTSGPSHTPPSDSETGASGSGRPSSGSSSRGRTAHGPEPSFFTLGSSKAEVLRVQGSPTNRAPLGVHREMWFYDSDEFSSYGAWVNFGPTGLVEGWGEWEDAKIRLKVHIVPGTRVTSSSYFAVRGHRDEVARLQGTPRNLMVNDENDLETWEFARGSNVYFAHSTGLVINWEDAPGILKVRGESPIKRDLWQKTLRQRQKSSVGKSGLDNNWSRIRDSKNPRTGTRDIIVKSKTTGFNCSLVVRIWEGRLEIFINWGTTVPNSFQTVSWEIDEEPGSSAEWRVSAHGKQTFAPDTEIRGIIRALSNPKNTVVSFRFSPASGELAEASFLIAGFTQVAEPLLKTWVEKDATETTATFQDIGPQTSYALGHPEKAIPCNKSWDCQELSLFLHVG